MNYPGSLGYGQEQVDRLTHELGELDVHSVLGVGHYLNTLSLASRTKGKKFIMGGSHGGYISSHLTARYPDDFDACVMRNPVVDLPYMLTGTDIPDWFVICRSLCLLPRTHKAMLSHRIYAETGLSYDFGKPPAILSPETFSHLHDRSPLKHADQVKTPTLLCVGLGDRRVPPDQARTWYHALKSFGKAHVEMLAYPDNGHALDGTVEAQWLGFRGIMEFLVRYTEF